MSGDPYDVQGEVRDALNTAVDSYGKRVLNDPRVLGNLVTDLLPDLPRERSLLVSAAEAGVAAELTQNVEGQHMDADTAVALAARSLAQNRSLDQAASLWVATEYAKALGYHVRSQVPPAAVAEHDMTMTSNQPPSPWAPGPPVPASNPAPGLNPNPDPALNPTPAADPWAAPTVGTPVVGSNPGPWGTPSASPNAGGWGTPAADPNAGSWGTPAVSSNGGSWGAAAVNSNPGGNPNAGGWGAPLAGPANPVPANPWPQAPGPNQGPWPSAAPASPKSRRGLFLGGGAAAAIIVVYLVIAAVGQVFPFSPAPSPTPTPVAPPASPKAIASSPGAATASPAPVSSSPAAAGLTLAPGVKKLKVLLPTDVTDASTECAALTGIKWSHPGLVASTNCSPTDLGDGGVLGYQFDSTADYNASWKNFNNWVPFGTSKSGDCPPSSGDSQGGPAEWGGPRFPYRSGQVLECYTGKAGPVYVWSYPTQDTFLVTVAPKGWTFSQLDKWWKDNSV